MELWRPEPGCHDDTVMALALANYVNDGKFKPVSHFGYVYRDDLKYGKI